MKDFVIKNGSVVVNLPYHPYAPEKFRNLGGKWEGDVWVFALDSNTKISKMQTDAIKKVIKDVYGYDVDDERTTVKIRFKDDAYAGKRPYLLGGKALSIARGRDSGAKVGDDVTLINGRIYSSGSAKNWSSEIEKDSVFIVKDFPIHADLCEDANIIEIESIGDEENDSLADVVVIIRGGVAEIISKPGLHVEVVDFDNIDENDIDRKEEIIKKAIEEYGK